MHIRAGIATTPRTLVPSVRLFDATRPPLFPSFGARAIINGAKSNIRADIISGISQGLPAARGAATRQPQYARVRPITWLRFITIPEWLAGMRCRAT